MPNYHWSISYGNGLVLVPTNVITTDGVFRITEPMYVTRVTDTQLLRKLIIEMIESGNSVVPHPSLQEINKKLVFQKKLGFKTYKDYTHKARVWSLEFQNGFFIIHPLRISSAGRGFVGSEGDAIIFPPHTAVEIVVDKLIELIQTAHLTRPPEKSFSAP